MKFYILGGLLAFFALVAGAIIEARFADKLVVEPDPYSSIFWDPTIPTIDKCYEYFYLHKEPCPDGYASMFVETPTSAAKTWCRESFGAVIECGRIVGVGQVVP